MKKQPTVRQINSHLASMTTYCYVYDAAGNYHMRITRARTRKGELQGRSLGTGQWVAIIPADHIALTYC